jgi:hypothetical protein
MQTRRKLVWVERPDFAGWACSDCDWTFVVPAAPAGEHLGSVVADVESLMEKGFASHLCEGHKRSSATSGSN